MTKKFKLVLFIRFLGYFLFLNGVLGIFLVFGPLIKAEFSFRTDLFLGVKRVVPKVITSEQSSQTGQTSSFGEIKTDYKSITPVSTSFGIVIEKINANARVIANVNPAKEKEYSKALSQGVAHAAGTTFPGEPGNIYLFSHSTDASWNIVRFNAVFYLLRELERGDRIIVFYQDRRYDYIVFDKQVVEPNDVSFLTNKYDEDSVLTLQTCDPPGTLFKRLIVRAKLAKV